MLVAEMRREGIEAGRGTWGIERVGGGVFLVDGGRGLVEGLVDEVEEGVVRTAPAREAWISLLWTWVPGPER